RFSRGNERVRYLRHLEQIEERDALALHGSNDGLWDFDLDRKTTYFSPRWKSMLGYGDDEVEALTDWQHMVHPDDLERGRTALGDPLAGIEPLFESVHRLRHRDGVWLWVVSRAKARVDEQGRAHRIAGVALEWAG